MSAAPQVSARTAISSRGSRPGQALMFAGMATAFASLYLSAGAPTPLLTLYLRQWNFSPPLLSMAFAVYAGGLLAALLTLGSLSDHLGRRPVILGALLVQLAAMALFLAATDISLVITARIVQGVATGVATTAFSAALVEIAPPDRKKLATILGSVGMAGGLALGTLLAGIAVEYAPEPNSIVFIPLAVLTVFGIVVVALSPETSPRHKGAARSLVPNVRVPGAARSEFAAAAPAIAAAWMLAGLSLGLAPTIVRNVFHLDSGLLNGFTSFIGPMVSALAGLAFIGAKARPAMFVGILATSAGAAGILGGILTGSLALMVIGQTLGGIGFGAAFTSALRLLIPAVQAQDRAATISAVYVVAYLGFSIPVILVGQLAAALGLIPAIAGYASATFALAIISLIGQFRQHRTTR